MEDINAVYPAQISQQHIEDDVFRWFVITLPGNEQIIDVELANEDDPTSLQPVRSRDATAVSRITTAGNQLEAGGVEAHHADFVDVLAGFPNDPYYHSSGSWGQPFDDLWFLKAINADKAWDVTTGSEGAIVAVVDSGFDFTHPDLVENLNAGQGNFWKNPGEIGLDANGNDRRFNGIDDDQNAFVDDWRGYDFDDLFDAVPDNDPTDDRGHGTAVTGLVAAIGNNNTDITGLMWDTPVMTLSQGYFPALDARVNGIIYATLHGARVINMSWYSLGNSPGWPMQQDAIRFAADHDVLLVAARGNTGNERAGSPANNPNVIGAGATNHQDQRADFSSYDNNVEVVAPGEDLLLLAAAEGDLHDDENTVADGLFVDSGTSGSAPLVAGLAGLLFSVHPDWTAAEVRSTIKATADDIGTPGYDMFTGHGRINAGQALSYNQPFPEATISSPPKRSARRRHQILQPEKFSIRGTAAGRTFKRYRVEVGKGTSPTSWTTRGITLHGNNGRNRVTDAPLARWDASSFSTGDYSIRLIVETTFGEEVSDVVFVNLPRSSAL